MQNLSLAYPRCPLFVKLSMVAGVLLLMTPLTLLSHDSDHWWRSLYVALMAYYGFGVLRHATNPAVLLHDGHLFAHGYHAPGKGMPLDGVVSWYFFEPTRELTATYEDGNVAKAKLPNLSREAMERLLATLAMQAPLAATRCARRAA